MWGEVIGQCALIEANRWREREEGREQESKGKTHLPTHTRYE
jgi:hypothetical protein